MNTPNIFVCPCCLHRLMRVSLDKKGRPYFHCTNCSSRMFLHGGALGVHAVANTLRMLDNEAVLEAIRRASYEDASKGPADGLHALLGVNAGSSSTITAASIDAAPVRKVG
jgi:DNA-directed RNA polymerase subunit RPC12/RpoP